MMNFLSYISYCLSLIPSWLMFVLIFLCVFLAVYLCIGLFYKDKHTLKVIDSQDDFDKLLSQVLSSKENKTANINTNETNIEPGVIAAITIAVSEMAKASHSSFNIKSIRPA